MLESNNLTSGIYVKKKANRVSRHKIHNWKIENSHPFEAKSCNCLIKLKFNFLEIEIDRKALNESNFSQCFQKHVLCFDSNQLHFKHVSAKLDLLLSN